MTIGMQGRVRWWVTVMIAAGLLCGPGGSGVRAAERTVYVGGPMVGGQTLEGLQAAVEEFTKRHPGVRAEMLQQSADAVKVAVAGGAPPDVVFVDGPLVSSWALAGIIQPLTPYIERDKVPKGGFIPPAWRQNEWNGDVWAMPVIVDPNFALTYNVELFANAGLDPDAPPARFPSWRAPSAG